tara:strand:+ start:116 stop:409 length:294 start_codon:yes stop_codon:yes gene_type:complete
MNDYYNKPMAWNGHSINALQGIQVDAISDNHGRTNWRAKVKDSDSRRAWTAWATYTEGPIIAAEKLIKEKELDWKLHDGCSLNGGNTYVFTLHRRAN